ncbi:expressed unknown protein [Seminavis robusta]|uniref:G-protein coupled receptors family 2 profile 2 domain-containing protein n=1 Tax=Seminavis robusta TaxID=568900 RepID=A0A9N8DMA4_9STRA|nr:expressed unknown protein [Seminavis robusta]|eukprot:Sro237_g095250.1 n/a (527) ;mRNA; r:31820-33498
MSSYSHAQLVSVALITKITSLISYVGCVWILLDVLGDAEKRRQVYHRLMLGYSIIFCIGGPFAIASTWPIPPDTQPYVVWAVGTDLSCHIQGFMIQVFASLFLYSTSLAAYFVMVIRFQWKERTIQRYEWFLHGVPWAFGLGTAIAGSAMDMYANSFLWCWFGGTEDAYIYRWAFYYAPLWFCFLLVLIGMGSILWRVHTTERESAKFEAQWKAKREIQRALEQEGDADEEQPGDLSDASSWASFRSNMSMGSVHEAITSVAQKRKEVKQWFRKRKRTRQVAMQAFLYVAAFYFSFFFSTINRLLQQISGRTSSFVWIQLHCIFAPLQGFFYFIIYRRQFVNQLRKQNKDMTWGQVIWASLQISLFKNVNLRWPSWCSWTSCSKTTNTATTTTTANNTTNDVKKETTTASSNSGNPCQSEEAKPPQTEESKDLDPTDPTDPSADHTGEDPIGHDCEAAEEEEQEEQEQRDSLFAACIGMTQQELAALRRYEPAPDKRKSKSCSDLFVINEDAAHKKKVLRRSDLHQ